jgi:hypothetical protein
MKTDGSARTKISPERILDSYGISPDGRWVSAETPGATEEQWLGTAKAFATDGSETVTVCLGHCLLNWDTSGRFLYLSFPGKHEKSYALPLSGASGLPALPPMGAWRLEDFTNRKPVAAIPWPVESAVNPSTYAYTRQNIRRNLYRLPLP